MKKPKHTHGTSAAFLAALVAAIGWSAPAGAHADGAADVERESTIYLTFDDGPSGFYTDEILEVLAANDAQATFFALGERMEANPAQALQIMAEGHALANHTWSHPDLTTLTRDEIDAEINSTAALLERFGSEAPCFRPPYGASNAEVDQAIADHGLNKQMWTVNTKDWSRPGTDAIVEDLLSAVPGDVILMHDGIGNRAQTVKALAIALPKLADRGYDFGITPDCGG